MTAVGPGDHHPAERNRRLDRHLFASNASAYNPAWETYGWTEGLDRVRAGRLEERVPWGAELAESAEPPTLVREGGRGPGPKADDPEVDGDALGTLGLPEAFLPLDGRLGFCLSGIVRPARQEARARRPRVATHTLLFDQALFREIDGFPQGLHLDLSAAGTAKATTPPEAAWFAQLRRSAPAAPGPLPTPDYRPNRERFRRARLREVERLARAAVAAGGARAVRGALADAYRKVGATSDSASAPVRAPTRDTPTGKGSRDGAVRVAGAHREACVVLRLAWLSLPLVDRVRVFYSMLDLRGRHPTPCLVPGAVFSGPGPGPRAGGAAPGATASAEGGPLETWAALVLGNPAEYGRASARFDARGLSLFRAASEPYVVHWAAARLGAVDLPERARLESRGSGRWRALGVLTAADLAARPPGQPPEWIDPIFREPLLASNRRFFDGLVRGFGGKVPGPWAARLAVLAGTGTRRRAEGLVLLVEGLRALAQAGADAGELGTAVGRTREQDGDETVAKLAGIVVELLEPLGRVADVPAMVDAAAIRDPMDSRLARDLIRVFLAQSGRAHPATHPATHPAWQTLLARVWLGLAAAGGADIGASEATSGPGATAPGRDQSRTVDPGVLQRLAWVELRTWGRTFLASLAAAGRPGAAALARRLMEHEPEPPLSLFLALRSALVRRRSALARRSSSAQRPVRKTRWPWRRSARRRSE